MKKKSAKKHKVKKVVHAKKKHAKKKHSKKKETPLVKEKIKKSLKEWSKGELHSGSKTGPKVTSKAQALAIGYSEGRKGKKKRKK